MKRAIPLSTFVFFGLASCCLAQDQSLSKLAAEAGVELKITSEREVPPSTAIGIVIPRGWKPTMKSFDDCRSLLKAMPDRKVINVRGPVKAEVFKRLTKLAEEFEDLKVNRTPIVSLGVWFTAKPLEITKVLFEDSGLKVGDKILQVNETSIKDFSELLLALSEFKPGTVIKVRVLRDDMKTTLAVKLSDTQRLLGR